MCHFARYPKDKISFIYFLLLSLFIYLFTSVFPFWSLGLYIGVGRFRILGGGAKGGTNSQQAHDVVMTSMRRNDVASTSFRRHVTNRFLINQCQIIAFLILKASTKFRIERNSFASTFKSNYSYIIYFIIILRFSLVHL